MIIVADATPIHYLSLIGEVEILKELFGRVIVPQAGVNVPILNERGSGIQRAPPQRWIRLSEVRGGECGGLRRR